MSASNAEAIRIMADFADRTGLSSDAAPRRYLWTDAFALCNYLELYRETGAERYRALAEKLIDQVHHVLGRHRQDDERSGWLIGLPDEEGALHPTIGGLRIGKPLPERGPDEPFDDRLEWERDGQYFHYLTKWIDALGRAAVLLNERNYCVQAAELAKAIVGPFVRRSPTGRAIGLSWKMSADLSRPLVSGMSPHDSLDGYVTYRVATVICQFPEAGQLGSEISLLRELSADVGWATADPLGIGGLLLDAFRLANLPGLQDGDEHLLENILVAAEAGLEQFLRSGALQEQPRRRLAFRELGLAIGLQSLSAIEAAASRSGVLTANMAASLQALAALARVENIIVDFWSAPKRWNDSTWQDHLDINEVMLVTGMLRAQVGTAPFPAD